MGLARAFILAGIFPAEEFGRYAIIIAVAMFLAPLPGLGLIEETRKQFPRLFVEGRLNEIPGRADSIARVVALRTLGIGACATIAAFAFGSQLLGTAMAAMTFVAIGTAWTSVLTSALRAGASALPLGVTAFIRAAITLPLTVVAAIEFGLRGALCAEAVGAMLGAALMRAALRSRGSNPGSVTNFVALASRAGLLVFVGSALVSVPIYLNRPLAALFLSPQEVGSLSFLILLVGVLQTSVAICDQVIGPRLVHWQHSGIALSIQKQRFLLIAAGLSFLCLIAFLAIWAGLQLPLAQEHVEKYALTASTFIPAALLAGLSITSTADWMLQAHDREKTITTAAAWNMAVFICVSGISIALDVPISLYIWGLAFAKFCQLIVQIVAVARLRVD